MNQSLPTSYLGPEKRRQLLIYREVKRLSGIRIGGRLPPTASTLGGRQAGGEEGSGPAAAVADEGQGVVQPHGEGVAGQLPQVQLRLLHLRVAMASLSLFQGSMHDGCVQESEAYWVGVGCVRVQSVGQRRRLGGGQ